CRPLRDRVMSELEPAVLKARIDGHDDDINRLSRNDDRLFDRLDRQNQWIIGLLVAILLAVLSAVIGIAVA
ncbi:MAG: hypothetical protein AAGD32_18190, partial [Planctomycetota bacterium]